MLSQHNVEIIVNIMTSVTITNIIISQIATHLTRWNIVALVQSVRVGRRNAVHGGFLPQARIDVDAAEECYRLNHTQSTHRKKTQKHKQN